MHTGLIIDRYRVERLVGEGGMAEVWSARHTVLGARRALKVLTRPGMSSLVREGQLQARIDHPNIVPVLDVLDHQGDLVLVMPLIEGPTLRDVLDQRPLDPSEAIGVFLAVLAAIEAAHAQGVVHRDIKPANILLQLRGDQAVPRVADFGISDTTASAQPPRFTTRAYAPPGRETGPEADFYSLGVLLHELLTGHRPTPGGDVVPVVGALLADASERLTDPGSPPRATNRARCGHPDFLALLSPALSPSTPWLLGCVCTPPPSPRDAFVGRQEELTDLQARISSPGLLSLVGTGGVGKTRLALHVARSVESTFPGGVVLVDLSEAHSGDDVLRMSGAALGIGAATGSHLGRAVAARGRILVVMDNLEQVAADAGPILAGWRTSALDATFLITSREPLRIVGEQIHRVDVLEPSDACELYLERARARGADVRSGPDLLRLVELLDRLPLAIELAASRARTHSVARLADRLDQRFSLLVSRRRDVPDRQRTLRATLDWSWERLDEPSQRALAQLSVFEGGFELDAAEAVVEVDGARVEDVLADLVDKSLVRIVSTPGEPRMALLASVQTYAAEQLAKLAGRDAVRDRHLAWFTASATEERFSMHGAEALLARARLDTENHRAALRWALAAGDAEAASRGAMMVFVLMRGWAPLRPLKPVFAVG